jgi:hypothetical protein
VPANQKHAIAVAGAQKKPPGKPGGFLWLGDRQGG